MTTTLDWASLLDALLWVERLGASECGLLAFGEQPSGGIFVERNRICWAAVHGLERRLRDLVRGHVAESDDFERAVRRHSAESLILLCASPTVTSWSTRRGRGYAPRFMFRPIDLLFDVVDVVLPGVRQRASSELSPLVGAGSRGASFYVDQRGGSVIPLTTFCDGSSVESLHLLGRWASLFPAATRELAALPSFTLARTNGGDTAFCWWHENLMHVVFCADTVSAASLASHHLGYP